MSIIAQENTNLIDQIGKWEGKSLGTPLGYRIFIFILKHLGIYAGYFVLFFVALYYFLFAPKSFKTSWFFHRNILKKSFFRSLSNVYWGFYRFGQTLLDKISIMAGISKKFTFNFDGKHYLERLATANQGAILLSAHVGNWEVAGHFLQKLDIPVNVVMYDNEYQQIKQVMNNAIGEKKFKIILIKDDFSHLLPLHNAMKNKEFICIHGDRFVKRNRNKTILIDFLGQKAPFPKGPFELTARFKIPYIFVYAFKETNTHYHFYAVPGSENKGDFRIILQEYTSSLEQVVRKFPTQWFNFYDFWKKEENG